MYVFCILGKKYEKKIQQCEVYCVRFKYMDCLLLKEIDLKSHGWIYISPEIFYNRPLIGVEFKFIKLR